MDILFYVITIVERNERERVKITEFQQNPTGRIKAVQM